MKFAALLAVSTFACLASARPTSQAVSPPYPTHLETRNLPLTFDGEGRPEVVVYTSDHFAPTGVDAVYNVLKARGGVGNIGEAIKDGIVLIVNAIKGAIEKDKQRRNDWTPRFIAQFSAKYPKQNAIMCHTKHDVHWEGIEGKDWGKTTAKFKPKLGLPVKYDVYWGGAGTFTNKGDGGYLNWAFTGNFKRDGNKVQFYKPT